MAISSSITNIDNMITSELPVIREALLNLQLSTGGDLRFSRGTSFPTSPATYDLFFNESIAKLCYWDGSSWLSVQTFALQPNVSYNQPTSAPPIAVATYSKPPANFRITHIVYSFNVQTTNDATNYYGVGLSSNTGTTLHSILTSTYAPSVWNVSENSVNITMASTPSHIRAITKVGSPGAIYLGATLYGREILG